ncbi:2OG-Fe(II) oxygenase [Streptomyces kronopolitis]|uniref:2OG-Fe(II) oxygenase n=1 Tax=Streptomyces kronopolitis TaxID=1612435 RepID=UPI003695FCFA
MTTQDTMARPDTVAEAPAATEEQSRVSTDAIWRLPVTVCRITNFLGRQMSGALLGRAIAAAGGALPPARVGDDRKLDLDVRRSRQDSSFPVPDLLSAIDEVVDAVGHTLGVSCQDTESDYSLNVHNDGDFFAVHQDTTTEFHPERVVTFVYYLHRTPRPFQGGHLRVFDVALPLHTEGSASWEDLTWRDWEPEHDSIVFFRPTAWHEVRKVSCPSKQHADSRFSINGWLCRPVRTSPGDGAS